MKIAFVTHNKNKMKEFSEFLLPEIELELIDMEYPELRSDFEEDVVTLAAKQLCELLKKPVLIEDSGFHITALSGFPGTLTASVHKRIGNKGFLALMKNEKDRRVYYKSAIGYCRPNESAIVFTGIERGRMARKERGNKGWGQDPIFVPEGTTRTYGEKRKEGDINVFRKKALKKLKTHLLNQ